MQVAEQVKYSQPKKIDITNRKDQQWLEEQGGQVFTLSFLRKIVEEMCSASPEQLGRTTLGSLLGYGPDNHYTEWLKQRNEEYETSRKPRQVGTGQRKRGSFRTAQSLSDSLQHFHLAEKRVVAIADIHGDMAVALLLLLLSGCLRISRRAFGKLGGGLDGGLDGRFEFTGLAVFCGDIVDGHRNASFGYSFPHEEVYLLQLLDHPMIKKVVGNHELERYFGNTRYCARDNDCTWFHPEGRNHVLGHYMSSRFPLILRIDTGPMHCLFMHTFADNLHGHLAAVQKHAEGSTSYIDVMNFGSTSRPSYIDIMNRLTRDILLGGGDEVSMGLVRDAVWGRDVVLAKRYDGLKELFVMCGCDPHMTVACIGHTFQQNWHRICVKPEGYSGSDCPHGTVLPLDRQSSRSFQPKDYNGVRNVMFTVLSGNTVLPVMVQC